MVAENLSSQVAQELAQLVRQLKEDRRKVRKEYVAFQTVCSVEFYFSVLCKIQFFFLLKIVPNRVFAKCSKSCFQNLSEGARLQAQLQSSLSLLAKTKEKYEKAFGASERALDAYQRADADLNLSRAEVEKARMHSTVKSQQVRHWK